jgi:hypothetical protein
MPFPVFGPGIIIAKRTDIANQTPVNIGFANELSFAEKATVKSLFGQVNRPLVIAKGTIKTTGKIKAAMISAYAWNSLFYAGTLAAGGLNYNMGELHTIGAGGGNLTVTNSNGYDQDLGAYYIASWQPLLKETTGSPSAGYYSLGAGGVYDFATADQSLAVGINYTNSSALGQSMTVSAQNIGTTPTFQLDYWTDLNSNPYAVRMLNCVMSDLTQDFKLEDFMMPAIDFEIGINAAQQAFTYQFPTTPPAVTS